MCNCIFVSRVAWDCPFCRRLFASHWILRFQEERIQQEAPLPTKILMRCPNRQMPKLQHKYKKQKKSKTIWLPGGIITPRLLYSNILKQRNCYKQVDGSNTGLRKKSKQHRKNSTKWMGKKNHQSKWQTYWEVQRNRKKTQGKGASSSFWRVASPERSFM